MEFDRWDLQKWFDISESTIYRYADRGEKKVKRVLVLNRLLEELRTNRDFRAENIPPDALNLIESSFLRFEEIGGKPKDVALLVKYRSWFESKLKDLNLKDSVEEVLGLERSTINA